MSEPTPEARAFARREALIHGFGADTADSVAFAAGWLAGVAHGRREAAETIRTEVIAGARMPEWAMPGGKPTAEGIRAWAASLAEGGAQELELGHGARIVWDDGTEGASEVREQWGCQHPLDDGPKDLGSRERATRIAGVVGVPLLTRTVVEYPDGTTVTGPWREATG